jgi:SAM-dependent methyltransferase
LELEEYRIMYEAEDSHWWYRGLRASMLSLLRLDPRRDRELRILDAGCGTGGNLAFLREQGFNRLEGFDYSEHALHFCHERGLHDVRQGSATEIPFGSGIYDVVISCDVLNDAGVKDEITALREIKRVLRPGGKLYLNLPALAFLAGEHDLATSVARRYTRASIAKLLREAGFRPRRITYRNTLLFPLIFLVRKLRPQKPGCEQVRSDIDLPPASVNAFLTFIMRIESYLMRYVNLPIGSSVSVVAQKPGKSE